MSHLIPMLLSDVVCRDVQEDLEDPTLRTWWERVLLRSCRRHFEKTRFFAFHIKRRKASFRGVPLGLPEHLKNIALHLYVFIFCKFVVLFCSLFYLEKPKACMPSFLERFIKIQAEWCRYMRPFSLKRKEVLCILDL